MKCRICARECPPGARICRDCAAARKRAFAATVTQPLLATAGASSVSRPRFAPQRAKPRPASKTVAASSARSEAVITASAADGVAAPRRLGVKWPLLGLAIVAAVGYLLLRMLAPNHNHATDDALVSGDAGSHGSAAAATAAPRPAPAAVAAPVDAAISSRTSTAASQSVNPVVALKNATKAARKVAGKVEAAKAPATEALPMPAAEPVAAPRSAPPRPAESPRDPWQAMNEGLSRCAREDWLSRGACEQRLRLQYCPNYWGLVPQCPIGPATDHGQ